MFDRTPLAPNRPGVPDIVQGRMMKFTQIGLFCSLLALAGCQTVDPNSPQELKKAEYQRLMTDASKANCTLLTDLNSRRAAQKKALVTDHRCGVITGTNPMGGIHPVSFVPDLAINGIPLPLGGLMKLAVQMDRNDRENKALATALPAWASQSEGAKQTYRLLLFFKFTPEEIATLKDSPDFRDAARKNGQSQQFAEANPQIAKEMRQPT
jgi:hypothetical protein